MFHSLILIGRENERMNVVFININRKSLNYRFLNDGSVEFDEQGVDSIELVEIYRNMWLV
jgi:hypothetical protein